MTHRRNRFDREFKLEAINLVIDSKRKVIDVAEELGIEHSTLDNWVRSCLCL